MTGPRRSPLVSIALPVYNGADTMTAVVESVLAQTHPDIELVISDNASTDGTQEICRQFAREDRRVVYLRQATNVGLLNNFVSAADHTSGRYVRWIGDDDSLEPDYVARVLEAFAEDQRRVVVTTQIVYRDDAGVETLDTGYDPSALSSTDPVERFAEMLRLLTTDFAMLDPLYSTMRRDLATIPRRNMLREDQIFAARLSLAGPWGHVAAPLAGRRREEGTAAGIAGLLGVPAWHRHVRVLLQCREMSHWVGRSGLDAEQQRRARAEIARFYARGKRIKALRGVAKLERLAGRPVLSPSGAR
ncbi:MAG TPA: glycosyltransferase family 2 protein [Nocardioides sp.]|uniref:glycosyltransferase family 2 protein n=1 Tax=Nocardioides sp. TaxID=35761 RepID=UPI002E327A3B|nr:glycosyltransferase family 2 protein [Nocardioides sp.]HEX5089026.1 glycosyltransferase family 2 protein [Nocardioides sp.]